MKLIAIELTKLIKVHAHLQYWQWSAILWLYSSECHWRCFQIHLTDKGKTDMMKPAAIKVIIPGGHTVCFTITSHFRM